MRWLVALAIGAVLLASCGGGDDDNLAAPKGGESAGDAAVRQLGFLDKGQWGPEWDELHPAQQALVPRDLWLSCMGKTATPNVSKIKVLTTYPDTISIPGTNISGPSTAVTLSYTASAGGQSEDTKATFHEFNVDGKWRWVLQDVEPYKSGDCQ